MHWSSCRPRPQESASPHSSARGSCSRRCNSSLSKALFYSVFLTKAQGVTTKHNSGRVIFSTVVPLLSWCPRSFLGPVSSFWCCMPCCPPDAVCHVPLATVCGPAVVKSTAQGQPGSKSCHCRSGTWVGGSTSLVFPSSSESYPSLRGAAREQSERRGVGGWGAEPGRAGARSVRAVGLLLWCAPVPPSSAILCPFELLS